MDKKGKLTTKPTGSQPSVPDATPTVEPLAKRSARQIVGRLADSGIDFALNYFWTGVVIVMTSIAIVIWYYIRSGRADWLYPYLNFVLGFIAASLLFVISAIYTQTRRRKALARAKNLRFVSEEKGLLDHKVNQKKAFIKFNSTLYALGKEIVKIGDVSSKGAAKIDKVKRFGGANADVELLRIASSVAAKLDKHSVRMEQLLTEFEDITNLLIESNVGYMTSPVMQQAKQQLMNDRVALETLLNTTTAALGSVGSFLDSQNSLRGFSQDLNTSINHMVYVTGGVIAAIHRAKNHWIELISIIDEKLNA
jgi:hypothetical protein